MLLLLLKDGTRLEISEAADVIHKLGFVVCVDHLNEPLITLPAGDVLAYTRNDKLAEDFIADKPEPAGRKRQRPATRRYGRPRRSN